MGFEGRVFRVPESFFGLEPVQEPCGDGRPIFAGSAEQIEEDILATRRRLVLLRVNYRLSDDLELSTTCSMDCPF